MTHRIGFIFLAAVIGWPVYAGELAPQRNMQISQQGNYQAGTEAASEDCCWDKVILDRPSQSYKPAVGPECCWMPVFGEINR